MKLPKNVFYLIIKYINTTLPIPSVKIFPSVFNQNHFYVSYFLTYLTQGRFTWGHNSILHFIASTFQSIPNSILSADVPGFVTLSVISGDTLLPDRLLHFQSKCLYIVELTVGLNPIW